MPIRATILDAGFWGGGQSTHSNLYRIESIRKETFEVETNDGRFKQVVEVSLAELWGYGRTLSPTFWRRSDGSDLAEPRIDPMAVLPCPELVPLSGGVRSRAEVASCPLPVSELEVVSGIGADPEGGGSGGSAGVFGGHRPVSALPWCVREGE